MPGPLEPPGRGGMAEDGRPVRIEVRVELKPGIMDPEATTVEKSLGLLGIAHLAHVGTAHLYVLEFSGVDRARAQALAREAVDRLLANPVIHRVSLTTLSE